MLAGELPQVLVGTRGASGAMTAPDCRLPGALIWPGALI